MMKRSYLHPVRLDLSKLKPKYRAEPEVPCVVRALSDFISQGNLKKSISSLYLLRSRRLRVDSRTIASLLNLCGEVRSSRYGRRVSQLMQVTGIKRSNQLLSDDLMRMFLKCGSYVEARKVFDDMPNRRLLTYITMISGYIRMGMIEAARLLFEQMPGKDVVSWNLMITAHAKLGFCHEALGFFFKLRQNYVRINAYSLAGVLTVSMKLRDEGLARQIHGQVIVFGFMNSVVLSSLVLDAYSKFQHLVDARRLFDDMQVRDVHSWTMLVSGYAVGADMVSATELFDQMPDKNAVAWTSMISGYARNGMGDEALRLFSTMVMLQIEPNAFTFSSGLCACAILPSLRHGKQIHAILLRTSLRPNAIVVASLIDMYSKCSRLELGRLVFNLMSKKNNIVLCNTMLSALARHGCGQEAMQMFDEILVSNVLPNSITFLIILNACCDFGFVQRGISFFEAMERYHIVPDEEHIACLTDLLGRTQ